MIQKTIFILSALTMLSIYTFYKKTHILEQKPQNIQDCEQVNNYIWKRETFDIDKDIQPSQLITMKAKFLSQQSGKMTQFRSEAYYYAVKLWSQTNKLEINYEKDKEVEISYQYKIPGVILSVKTDVKLYFYNENQELLNCLTFYVIL